jgi:hypothetical protein
MSTTTATHKNSPPSLPPISMFTSNRSQPQPPRSSLMPASPPPSSNYDLKIKSLPILPKPSEFYQKSNGNERPELLSPPPQHQQHHYYNHHQHQHQHHKSSTNSRITPPPQSTTTSAASSYSSTNSSTPHTPTNNIPPPAAPDQSTLWALFNQFQQQQQQQKAVDHHHYQEDATTRRASDPTNTTNKSATSTPTTMLSSEEVLAEKRRRNAGASARFRDRRKQRERELQDKCHELEQRNKEFESAIRRFDPDNPLLIKQPSTTAATADYTTRSISPPSTQDHDLFDRVGQLEHLMTRFRQEKETDVQKLDELEKEVSFFLFESKEERNTN